MNSWQSQDAKARFSEFLEAAIKKGPQIVTRRCVWVASGDALRKAFRQFPVGTFNPFHLGT